MFESPASILVYLLRFLASSGPSVLFLVRSGLLNYVAATLLMFFFPQLFPGQPATSSAARGAGAAPICERNQRLNTTCVGGSHWSNSKNMWSVPYVGSFLGQGWSGSEWDVHQWFHLRMKSCPSIHLKAGMGLPDFQTSNEATGVEAVSRFSAGFGIYDNSIWMRTPILSVPSSCIEPRFAR